MNLHHHLLPLLLLCASASAVASNPRRRLTHAEADTATAHIVAEWKRSERARLDYVSTEHVVRADTLTMPVDWRIFGARPAGGRSLYISLHGGGNAPAALNNSQWENQKFLYRPAEGVYLCPRAPYNDWDMHFKPLVDHCYRALITYCVTHLDVIPTASTSWVFAGGDGVATGARMATLGALHDAAICM